MTRGAMSFEIRNESAVKSRQLAEGRNQCATTQPVRRRSPSQDERCGRVSHGVPCVPTGVKSSCVSPGRLSWPCLGQPVELVPK